jgi:hypothetical protein
MAHQLVFKSETGKSRTYPVTGERISIGRHPTNTVVLDHGSVSIYHAEVVVEGGKTLLRDLQSSNGTKVNRKRISEITLTEGDEIRFGPIICHFRGEIWFNESVDASPDEPSKSNARIGEGPKKAPAKDDSKKSAVMEITATRTSSQQLSAPKSSIAKSAAPKVVTAKTTAPPSNSLKTSGPKSAPQKSDSPKTAPPKIELPAEPAVPLTFREKFRQKVAESRYFVLSLFLHTVVVILAGSIVLYQAIVEPPDFVAGDDGGLITSTDDLSPPPETPADSVPTEKIVQPQAPNVNAPTVDVITTSASNANFKVAIPQVQVKIPTNTATLTKAMSSFSSRGFTSLPGTMGGRIGSGRARAMALNGMKAKSEQAVLRGLVWLAQNQNEDGSWGEENKGAMTGFGLLCFLGHGELQDSPQFGKTVGRALSWVFENGSKNDGRLHMAEAFSAFGVYEHGICTYALGEYYTMTKDRRVTELFKKAIGHIIKGQGPGGGWMYSYDQSADDLSVSGWQIQALKAAHLSKLPIAGVDSALDKAMTYIERVRGSKGGYGYRSAANDYSLTGVGILCQLFWRPDRATLGKGMNWLLDETEKSKPVSYKGESADLYAWYYHTQACLMFGGDAWKKWNDWFQDEICDAQNPDGSWPIPGGRTVGPQNGDNLTASVYRTSLCILMLEVFYRYMPTNQG